jgi:toxin ParE1/3/4
MRVRWLTSALKSLQFSLRRIDAESPARARDLARRIKLSVARLEQFPQSGRIGTKPGTREVVNPRLPYIVVYRVTDCEVQVLRVFHSKQLAQ